MSLFSQVNHHHKNGSFKNKFLKPNSDYIPLDSPYSLVSGESIEIVCSAQTGYSFLLGNNTASNIYVLYSTTTLTVRGSSGVNRVFVISTVLNQVYTYRLSRVGDNLSLYIDNVFISTNALGVGEALVFNQVGMRDVPPFDASDIQVMSLTLGDEIYSLDEKSGYRVYGNKGSFGTRVTSNAGGLTYINSTMIEKL